jgi:hypothetical protein
MSPVVLSVCLLSSLTKPLSSAELRSRPAPGSLTYGLFAVRVAGTIWKGMPMGDAEKILGKPAGGWRVAKRRVGVMYPDLGLGVEYLPHPVVVGGQVKEVEYRVERVQFHSFPALHPRPAR